MTETRNSRNLPKVGKVKKTFISGLLIILPLLLTLFLLVWGFNLITSFTPELIDLIAEYVKPEVAEDLRTKYSFAVRIASILVILFITYFIGWLGRYFIGRKLMSWMEKSLLKIPLIRGIYSTIRQLSQSIFSDQGKMFNQVVMVAYPHSHSQVIAFRTNEAPDEICDKAGQKLISVFIPTTPNPTSGFLIMYPEDEIKVLDMSVTEGMRFVISAGAVTPGNQQDL